MLTFCALKDEYMALWLGMEIRPERKSEAMAMARRISGNRPRYDGVSRQTGVPWYVIGIIHALEAGLDFSKHLHNGDPLSRKTRLVPAGRPATHDGPFTWEESAVDALTMPGKAFDRITHWSIERIAYCLETFNGTGYRRYHPEVHSPYLWSFTTAYSRGKYIADGKWSSTAVSQQVGGMALLKCLIEIDRLGVDLEEPPASAVAAWPKAEVQTEASNVSVPKAAVKSRSVWALIAGAGAWATEKVQGAFDLLPQVADQASDMTGPIESLGHMLRVNLTGITSAVVIVAILIVIWRHAHDKAELTAMKTAAGTAEGDGT